MIIDKELLFSDKQAVTEDAASTNVVDTVVAGRAFEELFLEIVVHTTFDTAEEDGTLDITLQTDSDKAFGSAATLLTVEQFAEAALTAGTVIKRVRIPSGAERYLRLYYNVGTHAFTAGKINAYLVQVPQLHSIGS